MVWLTYNHLPTLLYHFHMQQVCMHVHTYVFYSQAEIEKFLDKVCDFFPVGRSEVSGAWSTWSMPTRRGCRVQVCLSSNIYTLRTLLCRQPHCLLYIIVYVIPPPAQVATGNDHNVQVCYLRQLIENHHT